MQTKQGSFIEACVNTLIGLIISLLVTPAVFYVCGVKYTGGQIILVTILMTAVSIARSYFIRRLFNALGSLEWFSWLSTGSRSRHREEGIQDIMQPYTEGSYGHYAEQLAVHINAYKKMTQEEKDGRPGIECRESVFKIHGKLKDLERAVGVYSGRGNRL